MKKLLACMIILMSAPAFAQEAYMLEPYLDAQRRYDEQQAAAQAAAEPVPAPQIAAQSQIPALQAQEYYADDVPVEETYDGAAAIPDEAAPSYAPNITSMNF